MSGEMTDFGPRHQKRSVVPKKSAENYVHRLMDPRHADNWLSAPIGTSDHIIILST
jgi:hypothetical protein